MPKLPPPTISELYTCSPKIIWRYIRHQPLGFWCICGYLFFEYVRPQSIYTWLDFFPWTSSFVIAALLFSFIKKEQQKPLTAIDKLVVAYALVVLLSAAAALEKSLAFSKLSAFLNWIIIYFAIIRTINTRERFFVFLLLYLLCNFKMSQHGFISWAQRGFSFANWGVTGSPGWFENSGEFGIQLTIFTPLVVAFIIALKSYWSKTLTYIFYLFPFTAIGSTVATSSRGALIGLIAAAFWSLKTSKYFFKTILAVGIIGSLIYFLTPPEFKARFESAGDDQTSRHRLDRWKQGREAVYKYPLLGVGHKNWEWYFSRYGDNLTEPGTPMVHNIFIESATEHGLIGLATLISIFFTMFRTNAKIRAANKENPDRFYYLLAHGMDGAVIGLIVSASFVTVLYYPYVWIHAAFISCLFNVSSTHIKNRGQRNTF